MKCLFTSRFLKLCWSFESFCIHGNYFLQWFLPLFIFSCVSSTLSCSCWYKKYIVLFLYIVYSPWPHLWFQISNSIAYFFLQLVEAKRNKANRKCTTTKHETGTQSSIFTSNRRDRRVFHITSTSAICWIKFETVRSWNFGRHCSGNASLCIHWSKTQISSVCYVTCFLHITAKVCVKEGLARYWFSEDSFSDP